MGSAVAYLVTIWALASIHLRYTRRASVPQYVESLVTVANSAG